LRPIFIADLSSKCCNPEINGGGGWGIFNSIFGWQNSATYGSVIAYNLYWVCVITTFLAMRYNETRGHWPFLNRKPETVFDAASTSGEECTQRRVSSDLDEIKSEEEGVKATTKNIDS
jgi:high-affinity iron transporter